MSMAAGPMSVTIRSAHEQDVSQFPDVERSAGETFRALPDLAWIADDTVMSVLEHLAHATAGVVLAATERAGKVVGFLTAENTGTALHIWIMAVVHDRQGQGLGRRLLDVATDRARELRLPALTLTTFVDVPWNAPFYQRCGFRILEPEELDGRLRSILQTEAAHGIPAARRCAMQLLVTALRI